MWNRSATTGAVQSSAAVRFTGRLFPLHLIAASALFLSTGCGTRLEKISDDVFFVRGTGGASNQVIVNTGHGPLVADARINPLLSDDVIKQARRFTGWEDVAYLLNTSPLPYRWLSNYTFKHAEIIASEQTLKTMMRDAPAFMNALQKRSPLPPWAGEIRPVLPTLTFSGKLVIRAPGKRLVIIEMPPGVAPGNSILWLPDEGVLYAGDLVTGETAPNLDYADPAAWEEALERIERLPVRTLLPGFGPREDPDTLLLKQKRAVRALETATGDVPQECMELWNRDPDLWNKIRRLGRKRSRR